MVSRKKLLCILSHKVMQYMHACMVSCGVVATIHIACMQVYFANWWMMSYGHPTPKRQQARSNWPWVSGLDLGKIAARTMKAQTQFQSTSWGLKQFAHYNMFFSLHACILQMHDWIEVAKVKAGVETKTSKLQGGFV